jgi:Fe-S-cluster containining protein
MAYQTETMFITGNLTDWLKQTGLGNNLDFRLKLEKMIVHYSGEFIKSSRIDKLGAILGFYSLIDENIENISPEVKAKIQCKKGCSYCCHTPVTISKAEADYIGYYCKKNNIRINKKYLKNQLRFSEAEIAFTPHSACVFLQNKTCSIYPARPFNCRRYLIFSDPIVCNVKIGKAGTEGYFDYNIDAIISGVFSMSEPGRLPEMLLPYAK